ncbi:MAG: VIT1/CCC1 transporter family protein [Candidatus Woesearchaeota archaeon]
MKEKKRNNHNHYNLKDIILGGQDGIVNVLGLSLGVAEATNDVNVVIIAGLAGTAAESISMAAVAYTSAQASRDYYISERGKAPEEWRHPSWDAFVVGLSSTIGSLIPLSPFFFFTIAKSMYASIMISLIALFVVGAAKAKYSIGSWQKSGIEVATIGILAALAGYAIGKLLGFTA